jgi:hypothetical protein
MPPTHVLPLRDTHRSPVWINLTKVVMVTECDVDEVLLIHIEGAGPVKAPLDRRNYVIERLENHLARMQPR